MSDNIKKAYSEILEIFKYIDEEELKKVPIEFIEKLEKQKDNNYKIKLDPNVPLEAQNLLEDTTNILAMLKLKYWCDNPKEKKKLITIIKQNEKYEKKD